MASPVLDTTRDCSAKADALRAAGCEAVMRYYSANAWKRIGAPEAQALSRAGLRIGVVYQNRQNQPDDFSEAAGRLAGQAAYGYAQSTIMQPFGSGIYFSADFDPPEDVVAGKINPFFLGVRNAILDANGGTVPYKIGVYGSGLTCRLMLEASLAELAWLAQSTGFREYDAFLHSRRWHLSQKMPGTVAGVGGDPNDTNPALPDFGGFTLAADHFGPALPPSSAYVVNAGTGLRLRGGPGTTFDVVDVLSEGTAVTLTDRDGDWAQVDVSGSGSPEGYVLAAFLKTA